ncbi:MAG: hypothetical protein ABSA45_03255 [Verrucomicrobiota bacterium]|jgi:hypothetical protein
MSEIRYRDLRAARPSVWASYRCKDDYGNPYIFKQRVAFWALTEEGRPVGMVIGTESKLPMPADGFNNFIGFEYPRGSVRRVPIQIY